MSHCSCQNHDDGSRTWERDCAEHGEDAILRQLVAPGTRIRDARHPELTGRIKAWEWASQGYISPLPYLIEWDEPSRAADLLGWFFVYGTPSDVEVAA